MSQLQFQKGKDAEVAWIDGQIVIRENQMDAKRLSADNEPMEGTERSIFVVIEIFQCF